MKLKTFIRYTGNKSKQLKHILPHIPKQYNTYIEPFVGSGAVFLALQPDKWIINDLNKYVINVWNNMKVDPEFIIDIFKDFGKIFKPLSKREKIDFCRIITSKINDMNYDIERASMYLLMKYCSYMGVIIKNNKFYFNGLELNIITGNRYSFLTNKYYNNLINIYNFLNNSNGLILNKNYKNILNKAKKGDFIFLDPPYIDEDDYDYLLKYNINEKIGLDFIIDLGKELKKLDNKGIKWIMTQSDTKDVKRIFKDYDIISYKVFRGYRKNYVNELRIKNF